MYNNKYIFIRTSMSISPQQRETHIQKTRQRQCKINKDIKED